MLGRKSSLGWTIGVAVLSLIARSAAAEGPLPPPSVSVTPVVGRQVTETGDFTGRVTAIDKVDIVARVPGFIEERNFTEGQQVKTGDLLFRIEQATYKAAVEQQRANLAKAKATEVNAALQLERGKELVRNQQHPASDTRSARGRRSGSAGQRDAGAGAARSGGNQSRLYRDPFTDRWAYRICQFHCRQSGRPLVREACDVVSQDPIYVIFQPSERDVLDYKRRVAESTDKSPHVTIHIQLPNGSTYPHAGLTNFLDVQVDTTTDTVAVRAQVPNPDGLLIPGGIVGVTVERGRHDLRW